MLQTTKPYLTTLTPLRGIAALFVVIFHANLMLMPFVPPGYTKFVENGWLWVDFFFILSGFIIFYVYGRHFEGGLTRTAYWKYIGARFARVYPLHLFTLGWAAICAIIIIAFADSLDPFFASIFDLKAIPASLLLIQSLHVFHMTPLNTPSWSLSTEWWVYMLFPFIVPLFSRLSFSGKGMMFLFITGCYLFIRYVLGPISGPFGEGPPSINVTYDFGLFRCLAGFLLGMLLYTFYNAGYGHSVFKKDGWFLIFSIATLIGMHFGIDELLILVLFPFLLLCAAYNASAVKRFLETRPLQRLGDWSFSIYLVHIPIAFMMTIFMVKDNPAMFSDFIKLVTSVPDYKLGLILCVALVVSTLVVAALTYRFVEVPARDYLNAWFSKPKTVAAEAPVISRDMETIGTDE